MGRPLIVLKFGGSVLRHEDDLARAAGEVERWIDRGWNVACVVSAFEGVTDTLIQRSKRFGADPEPESRALLTATGELESAALLGLALRRAGVEARVAPPWTIDLRAEADADDPLDAHPVTLDTGKARALLETARAIVVPGFIGLDDRGRLVLLGRGGSDLSAIFVAERLGAAKCRLIKDVSGLFEWDPATPSDDGSPPRRFETISWAHALTLDGGIVQHKAVRYARDRRLRFEVGSFNAESPTVVGDVAVRLAENSAVVA
ncbi:MAG: hypothetical protein K2W85_05785 [Phycisphaerales bacterium]|nr:hypothetical protein [Phycisphaerales bacterium]